MRQVLGHGTLEGVCPEPGEPRLRGDAKPFRRAPLVAPSFGAPLLDEQSERKSDPCGRHVAQFVDSVCVVCGRCELLALEVHHGQREHRKAASTRRGLACEATADEELFFRLRICIVNRVGQLRE